MSRVGYRWWHSRDPRHFARNRVPSRIPAVVNNVSKSPRVSDIRLSLSLWRKHPIVFRSILLSKQNDLCGICHKSCTSTDSNVDHIVPVSRGGPNCLLNLRVTHHECNAGRANGPDPYESNIELVLETGIVDDQVWTDFCHFPNALAPITADWIPVPIRGSGPSVRSTAVSSEGP